MIWGENPLFSETSLFEAPDRCMQLSKPIGRGVEGSPQPRPRPRPPRPRQGAPWEAQLRSTSGLLKQTRFSNGCFVITSEFFQKQILVSTSTRRFGHFGLLFLMIFWALWEAHFFHPEFVEAAAWLENSEPLGNSTRIRFFPFSSFRPQSLGSEVKSVPNRRFEWWELFKANWRLHATPKKAPGRDEGRNPKPKFEKLKVKAGLKAGTSLQLNLMMMMMMKISTPRAQVSQTVSPTVPSMRWDTLWGQGHELLLWYSKLKLEAATFTSQVLMINCFILFLCPSATLALSTHST